MQTPPPLSNFLHIKFWPTWLGLGLLCIIVWMPFPVRLKTGEVLGLLTYWLGKERRYITEINIALCFPELNEQDKSQLVKNCFQENGIGLIETVTAWVRKKEDFKKHLTVTGLDKLQEAQARGQGILLIGGHYSTLDFGGFLLSMIHPFAATYRPNANPLFNAFMLRGRLASCTGIFD
ncbi:MAG: lipid A biosynthesis acyltransferase, partial [Gammaproteobacteria bacterium]|nr:lipid A biosynthesis acyltransferase [Gammaproteobacteria bacterium]